MKKIILGLVGTLGAGKSSAVEHLTTKGFDYFKLSDVIREETHRKNLDRSSLQDFGDKLRKKFGADFLARRVWEKIGLAKSKRVLVDGLRNVGEVEFFRKKGNFYLLSIDKDRRARFRRLKIRSSDRDPKNWQEFLEMERRDLDEGADFGQQTARVMKMADLSIINNTPIEFFLELEKILAEIVK